MPEPETEIAIQEKLQIDTEIAFPFDNSMVHEQAYYVQLQIVPNDLQGAHEIYVRAEIQPEIAPDPEPDKVGTTVLEYPKVSYPFLCGIPSSF